MKWLKRAWQDIRHGQHIDSYATIIVSIVVVVLSLVDLVPASWLPPLTLAILALFSLAMLTTQHQSQTSALKMDTVVESLNELKEKIGRRVSADDIVRPAEELPPIRPLLQQCKTMWFSGKDLAGILTAFFGDIQEAAQQGKTFRFLICDPENQELMSCLAASSFLYPAASERKNAGQQALAYLTRLVSDTPPQAVQVRLAQWVPTNSYWIIDGENEHGQMLVTLYGYKVPRAQRCHMHLTRSTDSTTFGFYLEQFQRIWRDADPLQIAS